MEQSQRYHAIKENKINLADLMYYILLRWRSILLGALVFCSLLACLKLVKGFISLGREDLSETQKTYERSYEEYMIMKSQLESQADELAQSIKENEDYQRQSILMNLNPYAAYKSILTYAVNDIEDASWTASDMETRFVTNPKINSIIGSYASLVQNGTILHNVQKEIGTQVDKKYLAELIYVQADYQSNLLHITVFGDNKKQVQTISDAIEKEIKNAELRISSAAGEHRLELVSSYIGNDVDTSVLIGSIPEYGRSEDASYQTSIEKLQRNEADIVTDLQNQLTDCNNQLDELEEPTAPEETSRGAIIKSSIKFGILGLIVGAFVMAYFYVLQYVGGGKLRTFDEIQYTYMIPVMAIYKAPKCKHPNTIDKFINRIYGISEKKSCLSEVYTLATSNLLAHLENSAIVRILLVGNASTEVFDRTASEMREKLNDSDVEVIAAGNINENADAIQKLKIAENIVLIEQAGVSRKKDIKRELQTLRDLKKEIVGAIVL